MQSVNTFFLSWVPNKNCKNTYKEWLMFSFTQGNCDFTRKNIGILTTWTHSLNRYSSKCHKRKMFWYNLVQDLFWHPNPPVSRLVWRAMLSGQHDPRGLSHSHSCFCTKSRGSNLVGWHLLRVFPAHAWSTWRITRQEALPWYRHRREYGMGW